MTPDRPIVLFDLETTGVNTGVDRVTQIAALKIWPGEDPEAALEMLTRCAASGDKYAEADMLVNQTINPKTIVKPFILEMTHLTQEELNASLPFEEWAPWLHHFFSNSVKNGIDYGGVDLAGFNNNKFDNLMLEAEFKRAGCEFSLEGRNLLDAFAIFAKKEGRSLADAMKFYCDEDIEGAHNALVDIKATLQVFLAQSKEYEDMPADNAGIADYCKREGWIDTTGKFRWEGDEAVVNFSKDHLNNTIQDTAKYQSGFFNWMLKNDFPSDAQKIARDALAGIFPQKDK